MIYEYVCHKDRMTLDVTRSIHSEPEEVLCPQCQEPMQRLYTAPPVHYNSQGFHSTDYDSHGDKLERLNKEYSRITGETPPAPAKDVPRNSSEPY
jgi:putative FmdB family regulatory protein